MTLLQLRTTEELMLQLSENIPNAQPVSLLASCLLFRQWKHFFLSSTSDRGDDNPDPWIMLLTCYNIITKYLQGADESIQTSDLQFEKAIYSLHIKDLLWSTWEVSILRSIGWHVSKYVNKAHVLLEEKRKELELVVHHEDMVQEETIIYEKGQSFIPVQSSLYVYSQQPLSKF